MNRFESGLGARLILAALLLMLAVLSKPADASAPVSASVPARTSVPANLPASVSVPILVPVPARAIEFAAHPRARLWLPPLGYPIRISDPYRAPPNPYAAGHRGIGFPAQPGSALVSPTSGYVSFVGWVVDRGVISIRVDDRTVVSLEPIEVPDGTLVAGDFVHRGQRLGAMSEGGRCAAECVHLGVRVDGAYVNPLSYFVRRPELLPWRD